MLAAVVLATVAASLVVIVVAGVANHTVGPIRSVEVVGGSAAGSSAP
jgi:hypothetical protein